MEQILKVAALIAEAAAWVIREATGGNKKRL